MTHLSKIGNRGEHSLHVWQPGESRWEPGLAKTLGQIQTRYYAN